MKQDERYILVIPDNSGLGLFVTDCNGHTMEYTAETGNNHPSSLAQCQADLEALLFDIPDLEIYDIQESRII